MPRKTKEKSPKEKSPNLKDSEPESEDPVMDKAAINRLLQNALDEANASLRAEQNLEERLTALRELEEINKKHHNAATYSC